MVRHGNQALGRSHGNEAPGADKQDSSVDDLRRKLGKSNQGRDPPIANRTRLPKK